MSDQPPHGFTQRRAPRRWHEGFPVGNGVLGAMLWGDGSPLCITLDHADLWDLRVDAAALDDPRFTAAELRRLVAAGLHDEAVEVFDKRFRRENPVTPTKIHIGRAELRLGPASTYECSLDLDAAVVTGTLVSPERRHALEAFVHKERPLFCLRLTNTASDTVFVVRPLIDLSSETARLGHPAPVFGTNGECRSMTCRIPEGPAYAVAWTRYGDDHFLAAEIAPTPEQAVSLALAVLAEARDVGYTRLRGEHVAAWGRFWDRSSVVLPEPRMEFLWYYGLYLLAASASRGH
ncbi:MAG: glycoside hydrolase N-terminal domain-containing protein, partial [Lentisphaeria bacterium]|nr:glycoside hydrolase N-terminal domain-containing protein [Lentisphaeria bacterium]